jgi:saccharopine dehydrogenase-like NADP-dependent oxidoreductase
LAAHGLSVRLAGRRRGPLEDLARALAAEGAATDVRIVDVSDAASLAEAIAGAGVVLSTIGPFARQAVTAELRTGEGVGATAAIAAEVTRRVLAGAKPGAWTAGQLFGAALATDATGAQVTVTGQPA